MLINWRWPGVVGLYVFNAIGPLPLQSRGHVDAVTLFQRDDRPLRIRLLPEPVAEGLLLAPTDQRVDAFDLHVEQLLDRFLDLRFGGVLAHLEGHFVLLGSRRRLLGDHRSKDDVIMPRIAGAHLNRASRASSAALVSTS